MIDTLYKFSVFNTAASTILKEISAWLGHLGGTWFHVFTVWILYVFVSDVHTSSFADQFQQVSRLSIVCFLLTTVHLNIVTYGGAKSRHIAAIDAPILRSLSTVVQYICFAAILWYHIFGQVKDASTFLLSELVTGVSDGLFKWLSFTMTVVVFTGLVVMVHSGTTPAPGTKGRRKSLGRQRPPSVRIQAKQQQHYQQTARRNSRSRPATAKRRSSRS